MTTPKKYGPENYILFEPAIANWNGHFQIQTPTTVHLVDALPHIFIPYLDKGLNLGILADALEVCKHNLAVALRSRRYRLESLTDAQRKMITPDLIEMVNMSAPRGGGRWTEAYISERAAMVEAIKADIVKAVTKLHKENK